MKKVIIFLLILGYSYGAYSAEPLVKLPPKPTSEVLNDEEKYFKSVLDIYLAAQIYRLQLESANETVTDVPIPSWETIDYMDKKILAQLYTQMMNYHDRIKQLPDNPYKVEINKLRERVKILHSRIDSLESVSFENELIANHSDYFRLKSTELIKDIDSLIFETSKSRLECTEKLLKFREAMLNYCNQKYLCCNPVFSAGISGNIFFTTNGNDYVENKPAMGLLVSADIFSLFGWWNGLDLWYEYIKPEIRTKLYYGSDNEYYPLDWNSHISSLGFSKRYGPLVKSDVYHDGIKISLGYFWASGKVYNLPGSFSLDGGRLDLEYFAGSLGFRCPLEVYFGLMILHSFGKELIFYYGDNNHHSIEAGTTHMGLKLGLRFFIPSSTINLDK